MATSQSVTRRQSRNADAFNPEPAFPRLGARCPRMTAAILVQDTLAGLCLRAALRDKTGVLSCERVDELLPLLARQPVDIIIVAPWDSRGTAVAPVLRDIHRRWPSIPMAVYCRLTADAMREVVALIKSGVDDIILQGIDDRCQTLWSRLIVSVSRKAAQQALIALHPLLTEDVEPMVWYCLERAHSCLTVGDVATALQVHRRTLAHRMASAGLPAPSTMICWCRLLVAARLLEDPGRAVEQVALTLGFSSGAAFRNMLRRYTGLRPTELRFEGGLHCVVQQFKKGMRSPQLCFV